MPFQGEEFMRCHSGSVAPGYDGADFQPDRAVTMTFQGVSHAPILNEEARMAKFATTSKNSDKW